MTLGNLYDGHLAFTGISLINLEKSGCAIEAIYYKLNKSILKSNKREMEL
jgi:hypothetical protein